LIDTAREFGVTIVAYSPLGKGVLTGSYVSPFSLSVCIKLTSRIENLDNLPANDLRRSIPRFQPEYLPANLRLVREFKNMADKKKCTPGQLAVAWVIAQGAIPIPGTRNPDRLMENVGGRDVELSESDLEELRKLIEDAAPKGDR
jgi:aryl-alcohol dehydrogenase-like predicted oxidoreductase